MVNSVSRAWISAAWKEPLLLHAVVYAALMHRDFMRWSRVFPDSPVAISHKLAVIQKIREAILLGEDIARDEVILAILLLCWHDLGNATRKKEPFNSPLQSGSWLNVYGYAQQVPAHMKAVMTLVGLRGGVENLKLKGLAETVLGYVDVPQHSLHAWLLRLCSRSDLTISTTSLSKPKLPPFSRHKSAIASLRAWARSPLRMRPQGIASSFRLLKSYGITDYMLQTLESMGHITMAIDSFLQGMPGCLTFGVVIRTRAAVQKHVMLLPPAHELNVTPEPEPNIYECCRLTAVIYGIAVIYPIPSSQSPLQTLVQQLRAAIENSALESNNADCSGVTIWMLVLGGIAALDKPERPWFVSHLALLVARLDLDWTGVQEILGTFLWLDSACGAGGQHLWDEVLSIGL